MTVIKGNKTYFVRPGSAQQSDTESLHLGSASASDTESLNNETVRRPVRIFQALPLRSVQLEDQTHIKKSSGKKKLRRYQNRCVLQTLQEEDEPESTLIVIVDPYKSPFHRLLEDTNAMQFWNSFIEKTEEEQTNIINAFSEQYKPGCVQTIGDNYVGRVSSRVKREFKMKKNLSIENVKLYESQLIEFFTLSPEEVYVKSPPTSFDRLLLKAIAHYHGLQVKTNSPGENAKPTIEIYSHKQKWVPANCFLTDFIEQLR
ncbi:R3H domain-containing protein 4-like [Anthonomus grandis grandis]|uniref:R3H domain-containing protein 4-like n=1 Tax=Anthonomus grandis grandis TaxID=2921223 RepID=UPI0021667948|nr:R3H domain-containing protein 4-like [Anthonomus grandis grandis]